jgi:hypothetical protein
MANENCPNCAGHTQLDYLRDQFGSKLAKLLQDSMDEVYALTLEDTPEVTDRKRYFDIELADHLLWLAASIYTEEGLPGSEAIYELAKALEEVGSDPDEEPTDVNSSERPLSDAN